MPWIFLVQPSSHYTFLPLLASHIFPFNLLFIDDCQSWSLAFTCEKFPSWRFFQLFFTPRLEWIEFTHEAWQFPLASISQYPDLSSVTVMMPRGLDFTSETLYFALEWNRILHEAANILGCPVYCDGAKVIGFHLRSCGSKTCHVLRLNKFLSAWI